MTRHGPATGQQPPGRNPVLNQALAWAARGWPVFPCRPGGKAPATSHGYLDATTDPEQVTGWFAAHPELNLAVATGTPGPDVLDIDNHPAGTGFPALARLARAGLTRGAAAWVATPGGGLHAYYPGTGQRSGRLPRRHLDFKAAGGYVLLPPSRIGGRRYQLIAVTGRAGRLDWQQAMCLLEPDRQEHRQTARPGGQAAAGRLAAWVAALPEGNRNAGLFWAACRALEAGPGDLRGLAAAARTAGLGDREVAATLASAGRTARLFRDTGWQAEEGS